MNHNLIQAWLIDALKQNDKRKFEEIVTHHANNPEEAGYLEYLLYQVVISTMDIGKIKDMHTHYPKMSKGTLRENWHLTDCQAMANPDVLFAEIATFLYGETSNSYFVQSLINQTLMAFSRSQASDR